MWKLRACRVPSREWERTSQCHNVPYRTTVPKHKSLRHAMGRYGHYGTVQYVMLRFNWNSQNTPNPETHRTDIAFLNKINSKKT